MVGTADDPRPPPDLLARLNLRVDRYLGGRANKHWLVSTRHQRLILRPVLRLVLRRYQPDPIGEIAYELEVLRRLADLGWPTPVAVAAPVHCAGRTWCLFRWLPGRSPSGEDQLSHRDRGRLLARLHHDLATLTDLGQRAGAQRAEDVVADPDLTGQLRIYEQLFPDQARVMRWHVDRACEIFAGIDWSACPLMVSHGDFINQNLLYQNGVLTGVIDFEGTHLNHRVSEFALAWRGRHDAVLHGYNEVTELTEPDRELLTPALWSWAFLDVAREIRRMTDGTVPLHGFDWQIRILLRRSPLMGRHSKPYPGTV